MLCACTVPLATSHLKTNSKAGPKPSGKLVMRNSKRLGKSAARNERTKIPQSCQGQQIPLATEDENAQNQSVHPEDRALLGSNPSAAMDSNTAGRDGDPPSWHACLRDRSQCEKSNRY